MKNRHAGACPTDLGFMGLALGMNREMNRETRLILFAAVAICILCIIICCAYRVNSSHRLREAIRTGDYATFSELLSERNVNQKTRLSIDLTLPLIHEACAATRVDFVNLMITKGVDVHAQDSTGKTCVFYAVGGDDVAASIELARCLHLYDPTVFQSQEPVNGDNVLHYSVRIGLDSRIVEEIIQLGVDVKSVNSNGKTPLDVYFERGRKNNPVEAVLRGHLRNTTDEDLKSEPGVSQNGPQ